MSDFLLCNLHQLWYLWLTRQTSVQSLFICSLTLIVQVSPKQPSDQPEALQRLHHGKNGRFVFPCSFIPHLLDTHRHLQLDKCFMEQDAAVPGSVKRKCHFLSLLQHDEPARSFRCRTIISSRQESKHFIIQTHDDSIRCSSSACICVALWDAWNIYVYSVYVYHLYFVLWDPLEQCIFLIYTSFIYTLF